jgi:hypothetical protein
MERKGSFKTLVNFYQTKLYRRDKSVIFVPLSCTLKCTPYLTPSKGDTFIKVQILAVKGEGLNNKVALVCRKGG